MNEETVLGRTVVRTIFHDDKRNVWRPVCFNNANEDRKAYGQVMWTYGGMLLVELICEKKLKLYAFSIARGYFRIRYYDTMEQGDHDLMWHKAQTAPVIATKLDNPFLESSVYYFSQLFWKL